MSIFRTRSALAPGVRRCVDRRRCSQGVEAQTVANLYLALDHNLELLPVINKIDLPAADVERVREEIDKDLGLDPFAAIPVSAKTGVGIARRARRESSRSCLAPRATRTRR